MRKTMMICLLVLLSSLASYGQSQPQWKVVHSLFLTYQTTALPETPIFTATSAGVYRISGYFSQTGKKANQNLIVSWTDIAGYVEQITLGGVGNPQQLAAIIFVPRIGTPVTYSGNGTTGLYNVAFTIEQLQSSGD